jgi:hypothetical protein
MEATTTHALPIVRLALLEGNALPALDALQTMLVPLVPALITLCWLAWFGMLFVVVRYVLTTGVRSGEGGPEYYSDAS